MKLKPDGNLRRQLFAPEAMIHPAKGHIGLWWEIIERHTLPGQTILDPMAGVGTTMLAALLGRNVVCVEMESHFVAPMRASWEKMRQHGPMLGHTLGRVAIIQGDARCLPLDQVEAVVTSPPWEDGLALQDSKWLHEHEVQLAERFRQTHAGERGLPGNTKPENRRTLASYTRPVDAVVTSPPYESSVVGQGENQGERQWERFQQALADGNVSESTKARWKVGQRPASSNNLVVQPYTRPVDAVVTSPPYEGIDPGASASVVVASGGIGVQWRKQKMPAGDIAKLFGIAADYGKGGNIGNLRGEKYWEAMCQVYAGCHQVLRPGGVMVLVVKGFTRQGQYVDLPAQTVDCCQELGFKLKELWGRELWSLSFWRILQQRKDPAAFDNRLRIESVLVLTRG